VLGHAELKRKKAEIYDVKKNPVVFEMRVLVSGHTNVLRHRALCCMSALS